MSVFHFRPSGVELVKTHAEPVNTVRVGGETSATSELLVTSRSNHDGVLHRSEAGSVKRAHVEDVDSLHLTENLQTLETGGLLKIGGDGTGGGTRTEEILLSLDLCKVEASSANVAHHVTVHRPRLRGAIEALSTAALSIGRTLQDLVGADLLLGGASKSSGLLVRGGRAVGGITCSRSKNNSQPSYDEYHWLWGLGSKIERNAYGEQRR